MTTAYPIRAIEPGEYIAFLAVAEHAFNANWSTEAVQEFSRNVFEFDRSAAAFDGDQIVGTACTYTFRMTVPGGAVDAAGISAVAVLPTHRRRGIMSALIRYLLADAIDHGDPVAVLWAAEPEIYGRFGFGCASRQLRYAIPRGEPRLRLPEPPGRPAPGRPAPASASASEQANSERAEPESAESERAAGPLRLRIADPAKVHGELAAVYAPVAAARPGALARDDRWWTFETADPEFAREGQGPLRCLLAEDDAGPRGYALYSARPNWGDDGIPANQVTVRELMAADIRAEYALWSDLLSRDLVSEVKVAGRPVDDPLLELMGGPRRARARLLDGLWVRLTDVPAALRRRRYASDLDVVIEVTDTEISAHAGRWRLQARPGEPARCEATTAAADLTATAQALGAAYLGASSLSALAAAGHVTTARPAALAALATAMSWDLAPWCPTDF